MAGGGVQQMRIPAQEVEQAVQLVDIGDVEPFQLVQGHAIQLGQQLGFLVTVRVHVTRIQRRHVYPFPCLPLCCADQKMWPRSTIKRTHAPVTDPVRNENVACSGSSQASSRVRRRRPVHGHVLISLQQQTNRWTKGDASFASDVISSPTPNISKQYVAIVVEQSITCIDQANANEWLTDYDLHSIPLPSTASLSARSVRRDADANKARSTLDDQPENNKQISHLIHLIHLIHLAPCPLLALFQHHPTRLRHFKRRHLFSFTACMYNIHIILFIYLLFFVKFTVLLLSVHLRTP